MRKLTEEIGALLRTAGQIGDQLGEDGHAEPSAKIANDLLDLQRETDEGELEKGLRSIQGALREASALPGYHQCLKLAEDFLDCEPFEEEEDGEEEEDYEEEKDLREEAFTAARAVECVFFNGEWLTPVQAEDQLMEFFGRSRAADHTLATLGFPEDFEEIDPQHHDAFRALYSSFEDMAAIDRQDAEGALAESRVAV